MSKRSLDPREVDGIDHIVKLTLEYLEHPDVKALIVATKLKGAWEATQFYLQHHPENHVPSAALAEKLSYATQEAADVLSSPRVTHMHFAIRSTNVASELREVVRRMKNLRN